MTPLLHELERLARGDPAALERFLAERELPLVEGARVTFAWRGEADEVRLRHWIHGLESPLPFRRVEGSDLWLCSLELPEGSRIEYKLEVLRGGESEWIRDPFNPRLATDPYGANSVVHGPGYRLPEWTQPDPEARPGTLEPHEIHSDAFGGARPFSLYLPARFRPSRRYPLLVVHDGQDFLRHAGLKTVLDNLIHRLEIQPLVAALIDSPERLREYGDDPRHAEFLAAELVPLLEARLPLVGRPAGRGLLGASFGAVAALAAAWRQPGFFGALLLESGSFAFTDIGEHRGGPMFDPVVEFMNAFRRDPGRLAEKVYLTCGTYEPPIYYNRALLPVLQSTGMAVRYAEAPDGHNWENWRDRLQAGLSWLFPGPLWMVYE